VIIGPPTHVPRGVDRQGLELHRAQLERQMLLLTAVAETWAESGKRWPGQLPGEVRKAVPFSLRNPAGLADVREGCEPDGEMPAVWRIQPREESLT
jgi:hypothetical protein